MKTYINNIFHLINWYVIKNIKSVFGIKKYNDKQERIFNDIKIGDKVFCMMPVKPIDYIRIKEGHRNRPYIIVDKDDDYLYGYMCTTHPNKRLRRCDKVEIETFYDIEKKKSYVIPNSMYKISKEHILSYQGHIEDSVLSKVNRALYMLKNRNKTNKKLILFNVETNYCEGDVICIDGEYYYIYSMYNKDIYTYRIYMKNDDLHKIEINSQFKAIDFESNKQFVNLDINYLYDYMKKDEMKIIDKERKKYKYHIKNKEITEYRYNLKYECGSIMQYPWDDEIYIYIFSINNSNFIISLENCELGRFKMINRNLEYYDVIDRLTKESLLDLLNELKLENKEYQSIFKSLIAKIDDNI